jgi:hypothetical protein
MAANKVTAVHGESLGSPPEAKDKLGAVRGHGRLFFLRSAFVELPYCLIHLVVQIGSAFRAQARHRGTFYLIAIAIVPSEAG